MLREKRLGSPSIYIILLHTVVTEHNYFFFGGGGWGRGTLVISLLRPLKNYSVKYYRLTSL